MKSIGLAVLVSSVVLAGHVTPAVAQTSPTKIDPARYFERWVEVLGERSPRQTSHCTSQRVKELREATQAIEQWSAKIGELGESLSMDQALATARRLFEAKRRVDSLLDQTLELRTQFAARIAEPDHRDEARAFLAMTAQLLDLSGRLRYQLSETLIDLVQVYAQSDADCTKLVDLCLEYRSTIGAIQTASYLRSEGIVLPGERAGRERLQSHVLSLIAASGQASLVERVAEFLQSPALSPVLVIESAEAIRAVGLPQEARPGSPSDLPKPAITAKSLLERVRQLDATALSEAQLERHSKLVEWLKPIAASGLTEPVYRVGSFELRPGDWLLMRNPSPYNMFSDLAPGLFTHVGVVTLEKGTDGVNRMVLVDMPERGQRMPATNVDTYLLRTLNYLFLRHPDEPTAVRMSDAARSMIGNEIEFDLNFRTSRVTELRGQPLAGRKIQTYCAGLLLLCALQTDRPREEFFPVAEFPSSEQTLNNLGILGLSIGKDFISPTGALFSDKLQVVGRREPMYDPRREVDEAIFDHFAFGMRDKKLNNQAEVFGDIRIRLAEAAKLNPLLSQALAQANNVSADLDLVSAAKAVAVIDTLDEIAFGASGEYLAASRALRGPPVSELRREGASAVEIERTEKYLNRHSDLLRRIIDGRLTLRELRIALVDYYVKQGQSEMDRRFFASPKK